MTSPFLDCSCVASRLVVTVRAAASAAPLFPAEIFKAFFQ